MENEELNWRRQERERRRQQRLEEDRKLKMKLLIAAAVLIVSAVVIVLLANAFGKKDHKNTEKETETTSAAEKATEETTEKKIVGVKDESTVIHIKAVGDLNVTDSVILAGARSTGYDFTDCFMDVAPILSDADLTVLNLEGNLCGEPYGTKTTSAPIELAYALRSAGVDLVQMANSCSVNNGMSGLRSTLSALRNAGLEPLGAYADEDEFDEMQGYTICEVNGVKVAFVAFTKGVGSRGLPVGSEMCVNLLYEDYSTTYETVDKARIKGILKKVKAEKPDITIALLHWGSEYNDDHASTQETIVKLMTDNGVDVILGTHPHLVQQIEYDAETGQLIAYSLGDFFGDGSRSGSNYSVILDLEITRDESGKKTRVTNYTVTPIYTLKEEQCDGQRRVVRIREAMLAYDNNFVDKITKDAYDDMDYSLKRIKARIKGE